jgi:sec-independent protein translocase protein TatA
MPLGLGTTELIIILALALLFLGPKRLPDFGRTIGKGMREFKSTIGEVEEIKKSTIGQVDEIKDSFKVDLDLGLDGKATRKPAAAQANEPPARTG